MGLLLPALYPHVMYTNLQCNLICIVIMLNVNPKNVEFDRNAQTYIGNQWQFKVESAFDTISIAPFAVAAVATVSKLPTDEIFFTKSDTHINPTTEIKRQREK